MIPLEKCQAEWPQRHISVILWRNYQNSRPKSMDFEFKSLASS